MRPDLAQRVDKVRAARQPLPPHVANLAQHGVGDRHNRAAAGLPFRQRVVGPTIRRAVAAPQASESGRFGDFIVRDGIV